MRAVRMRRAVLAAGMTVVIAGATACGTVSGGGSGEASPGVDVAAKTIVIGASVAKTGGSAAVSENADAAQAALNMVNEQGGINGWKINYVVRDDAFDPSIAVSNTQQLIKSDNVFAMVGSVGTGTNAAVLPVVTQAGVPTLMNASAGLLTGQYANATSVFASIPAHANTAAFMLQYLVQQKKSQKIAFVYQDDDIGQSAKKGVDYWASQYGATLAASVAVPPGSTDYSAYAAKLRESGATDVLIFGLTPVAAGVIKADVAIGYTPKYVVPFFVSPSAIAPIVGDTVKDISFESYYTPLSAGTPEITSFLDAMKKYSTVQKPGHYSEGGWVTMNLFLDALRKATANGQVPTRDGLVAALNDGSTYQPGGLGVSLTYSVDNRIPKVDDAIYAYEGPDKTTEVFGPAPQPATPAQELD